MSRSADVRAEKALGLFLDRYFYPKLAVESGANIIQKRRISSRAEQVRGIDVVFPLGEKLVNIDEKAAVRHMGENLETFTFEIEFYSDKKDVEKYVDGWFINKESLTDYYLIMWIKKAAIDSTKIGRITAEDYEEVEAYLIDKRKIRENVDAIVINYANQLGISKLDDPYILYKKISSRIREKSDVYVYEPINENIELIYTPKWNEKPVNLKIGKERLLEMADYAYIITKDKIIAL